MKKNYYLDGYKIQTPEQRMEELKDYVSHALKNRGMQNLLEATISLLKDQNSWSNQSGQHEQSILDLIDNLSKTLEQYNKRHESE